MRRLIMLLTLVLAFAPVKVYAEDAVWEAPMPKGMSNGIRCIGYAEAGGHSYKDINYVGFDADEPVEEERAWQAAACDRFAREDVARYFLYHHGITIDPAIVVVTMERL